MKPFSFNVISVVLAASVSTMAFAKTVENRLNYDFTQGVVNAYGIHKPTTDAKNGLQAELEARKEGIRFATEQIQKSCGDDSKLVDGWKNNFKSLGSTIYPKGVLEIELSTTFKDVFVSYKNSKVQTPKTAEGDVIALKLPPVAPSQVSCGTIKIKSESQTYYIIPIAMTQTDAPLKTISLSMNDNALSVPASESALAAFLKDQHAKGKGTDKSPLALPIAVK